MYLFITNIFKNALYSNKNATTFFQNHKFDFTDIKTYGLANVSYFFIPNGFSRKL